MRFQHYFLVFFIFAMSLLFITEQKPGRSLKPLAWGACLFACLYFWVSKPPIYNENDLGALAIKSTGGNN